MARRRLNSALGAYSVRSATTVSCFAAMPDGMRPAMNVSAMLMRMSRTAPSTGRIALSVGRPVRWCTMRLMGMSRISVHRMPMTPAVKPSMIVSALNTREISC